MVTRRALFCTWQVLRTTVPLVIAPTTVTGGQNRPVRGLTAADFLLLDDGVPQRLHLDDTAMPVSLVFAVHATIGARKPLQKVREVVSLLEPLVTGEGGQAALLTIRDTVQAEIGFTSNLESIVRRLRTLEARGAGCSFVDAARLASELFASTDPGRRRILIVMAEAHDRTSTADLGTVLAQLQQQQVTAYALTYSPFLMEFGREAPVAP